MTKVTHQRLAPDGVEMINEADVEKLGMTKFADALTVFLDQMNDLAEGDDNKQKSFVASAILTISRRMIDLDKLGQDFYFGFLPGPFADFCTSEFQRVKQLSVDMAKVSIAEGGADDCECPLCQFRRDTDGAIGEKRVVN